MKNNTTMAIEHFNSYPHFVANQVLKCSDLNNSFGFLDEQARLSRIHMVGQGIVSGLDADNCKNTALRIGKGLALNSGGWVVQLNEDTDYHFVAKVPYLETPFETDNLEELVTKGGSRVEYICFKTEDDARELGLKPIAISTVLSGNYLVALAYGTRRELSNRCSHDSCDINVTSLLTEAWPVLVKPENAPLFKQLREFDLRLTDSTSIPVRIPSGSDIKSFNREVKKAFRERRRQCVSSMKSFFTNVFGQKYVKTQKGVGFVSKPSPWDHVFPESRQVFGRFNGCIVKTENLFASEPEDFVPDFVPDYFLSYISDLNLALNELIEAYNEYAAETVYLPDWIPEGRLTYLGKLTNLGDKSYKSLFRKADVLASESAALRLERMIRRIHILSEHFIGNKPQKVLSSMRALVSGQKPGCRLSEKPIPFYYDNTDIQFLTAWYADKSSFWQKSFSYGLGTKNSQIVMSPHLGLDYYLEGYHYKKYQSVKTCLDNNSPLAWMKLAVKNIPLNTARRLTPEQANVLVNYFANDNFRKICLPAIREKGNAKMIWLAKQLENIHTVNYGHSPYITDSIYALRDGEPYGFWMSFEFSKELKGQISELWGMTRIMKQALGLTYTDKKNRYADPLYSAFLNLFNILADSAATEVPLSLAFLNGPIRPGSTVCLFTKDENVISYAVVY